MSDGIGGAGASSTSAQVLRDTARFAGADTSVRRPAATQELSERDQQRVQELSSRDREVRAHEMAHVAAGGGLVISGPSYDYTTGPDGRRYAVAGEVQIDTSPGSTPEESLDKASRIQAAALAPAEPSTQDRQVAAQAAQMAAQARIELAQQERQDGIDRRGHASDPAAHTQHTEFKLRSAYGTIQHGAAPGTALGLFA